MDAPVRISRTSLAVCAIAFLSVFAGGLIYAFCRPGEACFPGWLGQPGLGSWIDAIRSFTLPPSAALPEWTVYSLPNGLWAFAYALVIVHIWQRRKTAMGILCLASVPVVPVAHEWMQYVQVLPGTGCLVDVLLGLFGAALGFRCATLLPARAEVALSGEIPARWATASFLIAMAAFAAGSDEANSTPAKLTKETTITSEGKTAISWVDESNNRISEIGNTDREGRFQGEVHRYFEGVQSESGPMKDGLKNGVWTVYIEESIERQELYFNGRCVDPYYLPEDPHKLLEKQDGAPPFWNGPALAAKSHASASRITRMLERFRPWVVRDLDCWGVDEATLDAVLASVEQFILQEQPQDRGELMRAYDDAIPATTNSGLFQDACDFMQSIAAVQFQVEAKNFPLRLAIFGWYLDGGGSLYDMFAANYPEFLAKLLADGATGAQIEAFLDELEGHLNALAPVDLNDPLLFDAIDQRIHAALDLVDENAHLAALLAMYGELNLIYRNSDPFLQAALEAFYGLVWDFRKAPHPTLDFYSDTNTLYSLQATPQLDPQVWQNVPGAGPRAGIGGSDALTDVNIPPVGRFYRLSMQAP